MWPITYFSIYRSNGRGEGWVLKGPQVLSVLGSRVCGERATESLYLGDPAQPLCWP